MSSRVASEPGEDFMNDTYTSNKVSNMYPSLYEITSNEVSNLFPKYTKENALQPFLYQSINQL